MASAPSSWFVKPTPGEIRTIAAIPDPVLRNLRITECYSRLSLAMRQRLGPEANWCTFATWASRQAGCTIRGEDLLDRIADRVRPGWSAQHPVRSLWRYLLRRGLLHPATRLGRLIQRVNSPFDSVERASASVARGNLKVFEEIGYEFARYLNEVAPVADLPSREFQQFLEGLRQAPLLRSAFENYQQLRSAPDATTRSQMILAANLHIGLHEQKRLQPEIQSALESLPDTVRDFRERLFLYMTSPLRKHARRIVREAISEHLMALRLPTGHLALGTHLDALTPACFHEVMYDELHRFLAHCALQCHDCGAEDWADLDQRMHYIFHLFRAYAFEERLFDLPFSREQIKQIQAGRIPDGALA